MPDREDSLWGDKMRKAVFFDRDGTINVDKHYLYQIDDFEFLPEVPRVLGELRKKGYLLILITNQSGIARGYFTVEQMNDLHQYMQCELAKYNAQFDDILFCPHHPQGMIPQYAICCSCRKPGRRLFEEAIKKHDIDSGASIAVGDNDRDLIPAKELGMKCIKISGESDGRWVTCNNFEKLNKLI